MARQAQKEDSLLIDLSLPPINSTKKEQQDNNNVNLFESLCMSDNSSLYGNVQLPAPLLSASEPDPFDVNARFSYSNHHRHQTTSSSLASASPNLLNKRGKDFESSPDSGHHGYSSSSPSSVFQDSFGASYQNTRLDAYSSTSNPGIENGQTLVCGLLYCEPPSENVQYQKINPSYLSHLSADTVTQSAIASHNLNQRPQAPFNAQRQFSAGVGSSSPPAAIDSSFRRHLESLVNSANSSRTIASNSKGDNNPGDLRLSDVRSKSVNLPPQNVNTFVNESHDQSRNPFRSSSVGGHQVVKPSATVSFADPLLSKQKEKSIKAFEWLDSALTNYSVTPKTNAKSENSIEDAMNRKNHQRVVGGSSPNYRSDSLPLYSEVPEDEEDCCSERHLSEGQATQDMAFRPTGFLPKYDSVPDESSDLSSFHPSQYSNLGSSSSAFEEVKKQPDADSPTSSSYYAALSDSTWDDDFDDDFDETYIKGLSLQDAANRVNAAEADAQGTSDVPPPLPPRDYSEQSCQSTAEVHPPLRSSPEKPNIFPMKQGGQQVSDTHYFLIPSKTEPSHHHHSNPASPRKAPSSPHKSTATVYPFLVNSAYDSSSDVADTSYNYQNLSGFIDRNLVQRSVSNSSKTSKSSTGSCSSTGSTSQHQLRHHHGTSSKSAMSSYTSKPQQIQSPVKSVMKESEDNFLSSSPRERIGDVLSAVMGVTDEECYAALSVMHWDVDKSIRYLKVEQLFRLGAASRESCQKLLENLDWNLELASSVIIDQVRDKVQMESNV